MEPMASKFWEESADESSYSEEEPEIQLPVVPEKRVEPEPVPEPEAEREQRPRNAQEKKYEELRHAGHKMKEAIKIHDFGEVKECYGKLVQVMASLSKQKGVGAAANVDANTKRYPNFFLRRLVELEDFLAEFRSKDKKKELSKARATALNGLQNRVRKHLLEADDLKQLLEDFRAGGFHEKADTESESEPDVSE
eukprot:GHVU01038038.1.p1 GENE.GHVU01038038.1~~GHVU01038038.1.p1  ORF type:complete len:195 (-),score=41.97 GHVU01038038.1:159-743(-)